MRQQFQTLGLMVGFYSMGVGISIIKVSSHLTYPLLVIA